MPLNKEQQEAVSYLEGPLLVLAGPGTGKTQLLSAKVAYILEHTDTNPENILCLTFTESGARNMRERLGTMVGRAADNVNIYTYHAFGSNILDRYKNYAENFDRRLDAVIDGVTQYKIVRSIQQELPALDILKTAKISDLVETIGHAKSARLNSHDLKKIAEQNISDSETISAEASSVLQNLVPRMRFSAALEQVYQPLLELLVSHTSDQPIVGNIERIANFLARELASLINEEGSKEKPTVGKLSKWREKYFELTSSGSYRLKDYIKNKKLLSLAYVMEQYENKLRTEGLFDFADMIEEAIHVLREDEGFRLTMSQVFQYILLDEFQDTNPSQFEIIKLLTDYEKPVVMAVGDDDQAIFEFQGANASNLLDFQENYHAKVITLLDNYRSTGDILAFSHRVADQMNESFAKVRNINKVLRSMTDIFRREQKVLSDSSKNHVKIERHEFLSSPDEYYWVSERIQELIKKGESPEEIAVIAPKHKYLLPLLPYLKERGINLSYEKKSNLLDDPRMHEIIVLSRFLNELTNETQPNHRLLEILSFPFFEVDSLTALQAVQQAKTLKKSTLSYLSESDNEKLKTLANWLADLALLSFNTPLEQWLDYLIGNVETPTQSNKASFRSPYLSYYDNHSSDIEKFEFYENLAALRNVTVDHVQNQKLHLQDFVQTLDDYEEAEAAIVNTSPYQDGNHAIQLMSAHKSKGLEFKHVYMIAVDDAAWGKARGNNNLFALPCNLLQIRHTGITEDEQLRLLFVAITRAKEHLVMTNAKQDFSNKPTARLAYLNEQRDEKAERQISPYLPAEAQDIITHYDDFNIDTRISSIKNSWISNYQVMTPELKICLAERLKSYRLNSTDLTTFIDIIYAGPQEFYRRRILQAPDEPANSSLIYGNIFHQVFEQVTSHGITDEKAVELAIEKTLEAPLSTLEVANLREKVQHGLKIALQDFSDIIRKPGAKAEINLSSEHLTFDGIPITGKIDHINIDAQAKTIEVYDFKTGKYKDSKWEREPTLYKYALQLEFYKLMLNLSPTYRNYKVTSGHILFVSPDEDNKVYDKVYDFESSNITETFRKIISKIYRHITTLDFVTDPNLNLAPDKSRTMKDINKFIEVILADS